MAQALEGIRVIDFTDVEQGPVGTMMLGDFGADIIKVEPVGRGATHRATPPILHDIGIFFVSLNRNKRSLPVDLKQPEGKEIIYRLVKGADVVVNNFRVGVMERLDLSYDRLRKVNPRIVYAHASGFGAKGPFAHRKGQDLVAQAMSGAMYMAGRPGSPPMASANYKADYTGGMHMAIGVLIALLHRERTGEGQRIDSSLLEGQIANQVQELETYLNAGQERRDPQGHRVYKTKDGYIAAGGGLKDACDLVGMEDLTQNPLFDTREKQVDNMASWRALVEPYFLEKTTEEWDALLAAQDILGGPVLDYGEAFQHPQVLAQDMIMEIEHPHGGSFKTVGFPIKMSKTPAAIRYRAPAYGEHTEEILREAGYTREIDDLASRSVVGLPKIPDTAKSR